MKKKKMIINLMTIKFPKKPLKVNQRLNLIQNQPQKIKERQKKQNYNKTLRHRRTIQILHKFFGIKITHLALLLPRS